MNTIPREIMKARIDNLDLEPIKFKLVKEHSYTKSQVDALEKWYKRFLFLTFNHSEQPIVVCRAIDEFWHQHILDTAKYAEDCQNAFGEFLHHFPYFGLRGEDDQQALQKAYRDTLRLMDAEYGESPENELNFAPEAAGAMSSEAASSCSDCDHIWPSVAPAIQTHRPRLSDSMQ